MNEDIRRKLKRSKAFRAGLFLLFIVWLCVIIFVLPYTDATDTAPYVFIFIMFLLVYLLIYIGSYHQFLCCMAWLKRNGYEDIADDIDLCKPTFEKSKIYCGNRAFVCKKPWLVIPYSEIAWVCDAENGFALFLRDGKKFTFDPDVREFFLLLKKYVLPHSSDMVLGSENEDLYKHSNPRHMEHSKRLMRIWGYVLASIAAIFIVATIFNLKTAELGILSVLICSLLCISLVLLIFGNKK